MSHPTVRAAVVQACAERDGVPLSLAESLDLAQRLLRDAAEGGAHIVVFPEAFLGGYPKGEDFGVLLGSRSDEGRAAFAKYFERSIEVIGGAVTRSLRVCVQRVAQQFEDHNPIDRRRFVVRIEQFFNVLELSYQKFLQSGAPDFYFFYQ